MESQASLTGHPSVSNYTDIQWTKWQLPSNICVLYRNFRMRIGQNTLHFKSRNRHNCLKVECKHCHSSLSQRSNPCTCKKHWRQLPISRKAQTKCKIVKTRNHIFKCKVKAKVNERHRNVTKVFLPALLCILKKQMKIASLFKIWLSCIYYSSTTATWCII